MGAPLELYVILSEVRNIFAGCWGLCTHGWIYILQFFLVEHIPLCLNIILK
jgi:hypothetical protein